MASARKFLGKGQLAATNTTMYAPTGNAVGTIGVLSFYNTSSTAQVTITVYAQHTGTPDRILDRVVLNPQKSYISRSAINQVVESGYLISALASTGALVDFTISGAEE